MRKFLLNTVVPYALKKLMGEYVGYNPSENVHARDFLKRIHRTKGFDQYCIQRISKLKCHFLNDLSHEEYMRNKGSIEEIKRLQWFSQQAALRVEKDTD